MRFFILAFPLLAIPLSPAAHAAAPFQGSWACTGTVVNIDDSDVKTGCTVPKLTIRQCALSFSWDGRVQCPDGTDAPFNEADALKGNTILDAQGAAIGTLSDTKFVSSYDSSGLSYATTMSLNARGTALHFQHDRVSGGVPLLRWAFDCLPQN